MGERKELRYFNDHTRFVSSKIDYQLYHTNFLYKSTAKIYGEVTPTYIYDQRALDRLYTYNPNIKILAVLRNPIERAYSHWAMEVQNGHETRSFKEALALEFRRWRIEDPSRNPWFAYITCGFYTEQIRRLWRIFSPDQILLIKSDSLDSNPDVTMAEVFNFLYVDRVPILQTIKARAGAYKAKIPPDDRKRLLELFEFEVKQLERMLGWDCSSWLM